MQAVRVNTVLRNICIDLTYTDSYPELLYKMYFFLYGLGPKSWKKVGWLIFSGPSGSNWLFT